MTCPPGALWFILLAVFGAVSFTSLVLYGAYAFIKWALSPRERKTYVGTIPRKRRLFRVR